jgi:UDP-4-amino-4,6-dideoxy-N-acetyl-beta-L-altrosamine transaminase
MNIPYGRQSVNKNDIDAVSDVLKSDYLTQGPVVPKFESAIALNTGAKYAVAVNSATSALHLACLALDVGPGDHVWTSPITFVASANCALYCRANVDFIDIDSRTYNMSVAALTEKLQQANKTNTLPKVLISVHLAGQSCEMKAIHSLSIKYGFKIIEDASHAIGARYLDKPVGNCCYSDITIFSFHPVKIMTTGEGGMAVTNNHNLAITMQRLRSHGITRDPSEMVSESDGPWYYQQLDLGFNYRMTDIQAALGLSQLKRMKKFVVKRNSLSKRYNELLKDLPVTLPWQHPDCFSAWHLYIIRLPIKSKSFDRLRIFEKFRSSGIGVNVHYMPVYRQPYYKKFNYNYDDFPEAENYYLESISLPLFPDLTEQQQVFIAKILSSPIR